MFLYSAIIIEPRKHNAFKFVLDNFLENLSDEWGIIIFHGLLNDIYVKNIVDELDEKQKSRIINVINLQVDNLDNRTYSQLFFSQTLYDFIPTETFLVFQTDSMILPENKHLINEFLHYDYVGAPWVDGVVGNGGLSLRKKSKMLEIIKHKHYKNINEDWFFSRNIPSFINYHVPPCIHAKKFSIETVFDDSPFGVHNFWKYFSTENKEILLSKYPYLKTLIQLNE
jgi:hypothetical protein